MLIREALGAVLRDERHRRNWTMRELIDRSPMAIGYLSEIERGKKEPSSEVIGLVSRALGITESEILRRTAAVMER